MKNKTLAYLQHNYSAIHHPGLEQRYLPYEKMISVLDEFAGSFSVDIIGRSVLGRNISSVKFGNGPIKVLAWSQMHGNESTTTRAVFDLLSLFRDYSEIPVVREIISSCTIIIIPMLNPDGATAYTRHNSNSVDLNRDASKRSQPESKALGNILETFQPDFCFNLHDQRTIFAVGETPRPATLSFLAPSIDPQRSIPPERALAMDLIWAIEEDLREFLPGQMGRFDDSFNINCTGDKFQSMGIPTILFEAGHYQRDYSREKSREFTFYAIFSALKHITDRDFRRDSPSGYFEIPDNRKSFCDILLREAEIPSGKMDIAIQFEEQMISGGITFIPVVAAIVETNKNGMFGHREIDCKGQRVSNIDGSEIKENDVVKHFLLKNTEVSLNI